MTPVVEPSGWDLVEGAEVFGSARPRMSDMLDRVASHNGLSRSELIAPGRRQHVSVPRQAFMAAAIGAGFSYPQVGRFLGGRDHSTIIHGVEAHRRRYAAGEVNEFGRET